MAAEHSGGPQWIPTDFRRSDVVGFTEVRPLKKLKLASSAAWPAVQAMAGARNLAGKLCWFQAVKETIVKNDRHCRSKHWKGEA